MILPDKIEAQRYVARLLAYAHELESLIDDDDWREVIHNSGHIEQECVELIAYINGFDK